MATKIDMTGLDADVALSYDREHGTYSAVARDLDTGQIIARVKGWPFEGQALEALEIEIEGARERARIADARPGGLVGAFLRLGAAIEAMPAQERAKRARMTRSLDETTRAKDEAEFWYSANAREARRERKIARLRRTLEMKRRRKAAQR